MKGTILDFSVQTNSGLISGDDGNRYTFEGAEWKDSKLPAKGNRVDFEGADGKAKAIYIMPGFDNTASVFGGEDWCRSSDDKVIAGVCGGLAQKLQITPTALRVITALTSIFFIVPIIIYIVLWIALPERPTKAA